MSKRAKRKRGDLADLADWSGGRMLVRELRQVLEDDAKRGAGVLAHWHTVADKNLWALAFASFWRAYCSGDARAEDEAARRLLLLPGKLIPDPQWKRAQLAGIRGEVDPEGSDPHWKSRLLDEFYELAPAVTRLVAPGAIRAVLGPGRDPKHPAPWIKARWKLADRVQGRRAAELVASRLGEEPRRRIRRETREERVTGDILERRVKEAILADPIHSPEEALVDGGPGEVEVAYLEEALLSLSPARQRAWVFEWHVRSEGWTQAEMAVFAGMSPAGYRKNLERARRDLAAELDRWRPLRPDSGPGSDPSTTRILEREREAWKRRHNYPDEQRLKR